jgi:phospholipid transport system substrate-binding protein
MSRLHRLAVASIALGVFIQTCRAGSAAPARAEAEKGIASIVAILGDRNLSAEQRADKLKATVEDWLDFETLSRLSLGGAWRDLSDAQRESFVGEFRQHMVGVANKSTKGYDDEQVIILNDRQEPKGDWTVMTTILKKPKDGAAEEVAKVDFRLRLKEDRWKVIDINIAGISMAATFRAQFLVIMKDGGIDKLLKMMREKNAANPEKPTRTADADK